MARPIPKIQEAITDELETKVPGLSTSKVGEWSLWTYIVSVAIHSFELIMDLFRKEMDDLTDKITPGTLRWYAEMCKRFQNGDELKFDAKTALLYYPKEDPAKQIIAVVAVTENIGDTNHLFIKVAKKDAHGKIMALDANEKYNFTNYIDAIKFAGCQTDIISTDADQINYELTVYHDPSIPKDVVEDNVGKAVEAFKTNIDFDGVLYRQQFIDAVMAVNGVITCTLDRFEQHVYEDEKDKWEEISTHTTLQAGYFEYAATCRITPKSVNELIKGKTSDTIATDK